VRNEYRMASQALEADTYKVGVHVTGQPSIGESWTTFWGTLNLNLMRLSHAVRENTFSLALRLGQEQPVAVPFLNVKEFYGKRND